MPQRRSEGIGPKERIDTLLVRRQLVEDEHTARAWIMSGKVLVNGQPITKCGDRVDCSSDVHVRGLDQKYASRGGYKLEAALAEFGISVQNKVVLDAGAAAGGFTSCLLQKGARLVYAVDVGFGQMKGSLAINPAVRNLEKTNIGDLRLEHFNPPIEIAVADLSYLSLGKAIPILKNLFPGVVTILCLIKPLFEGVSHLRRNHIGDLSDALCRVNDAAHRNGLSIANLMVSPIVGTRSTIEFMGLFVEGIGDHPDFEDLRPRALSDAKRRFPDIIEGA